MLVPYNDPSTTAAGRRLRFRRAGAAGGQRLERQGARPASEARRGCSDIFNQGRLALIQRVGYENSSRSHFTGTDIWSTANPSNSQGPGWVGRYLATLPPPLDPLAAWNTTGDTPHALQSRACRSPSIPSVGGYAFSSPNTGIEATLERYGRSAIASHVPVDQPQHGVCRATGAGCDGHARPRGSVGHLQAEHRRIRTTASARRCRRSPARWRRASARRCSACRRADSTRTRRRTRRDAGAYVKLMATLDDGLAAFYNDLKNQGLLDDTLVLSFSEFGRRITENGSKGTDHGAASVMLAMGGAFRRAVRHGGVAQPRPAESDAREQRRRRALRNRLPFGLRPSDRQLARRRLGRRARRQLPEKRARLHLDG